MIRSEQLLLLQLILEDVRGDWSCYVAKRLTVALKLAKALDLAEHVRTIENGILDESVDGFDGRMFRKDWAQGGYENAAQVHGLSPNINGRSLDFQRVATAVLNYPDLRFDDWDAYLASLP